MIDLLDRPRDEAPADAPALDIIQIGKALLTREEISDPHSFLATERGKQWLEKVSGGVYYQRYYRCGNEYPLSLSEGANLAGEIIDALRGGGEHAVMNAIEKSFGHGVCAESEFDERYEDEFENEILDMAEQAEEIGFELDQELWQEAARETMVDLMYEEDDSSVLDLLTSYDRAEIFFRFGKDEEDVIYSNAGWSDFEHLHIDGALQNALAGMGYTISEYRRMSGNKTASCDLKRGVRRQRQPIVTSEQLREIVDNACSTSFLIVLYAIVPIADLIKLDLTKPIALSKFAVASYNSWNGTFHDVLIDRAITLDPRDGKLCAVSGYRPEDICGLYVPPYEARISNI